MFDLPIPTREPYPEWWIPYTVRYQLDQMTHGKGIASGYLSFVYREHPLFPCWFADDQTPGDVTINGTKVSCFTNAQFAVGQTHDPAAPGGIGTTGRLRVQAGDETRTVDVTAGGQWMCR